MSGLQLMLTTLSQLFYSPLPALLNPVLVKARLSLSQTQKGFYPQPARRFMQIPEVSAPICRAAASQTSPPPLSMDGGAGHCLLQKNDIAALGGTWLQ